MERPPEEHAHIVTPDPLKISTEKKIAEAIINLGGSASGAQIRNSLLQDYNVTDAMRRSLLFRINAILSKKGQVFQKGEKTFNKETREQASAWTLMPVSFYSIPSQIFVPL